MIPSALIEQFHHIFGRLPLVAARAPGRVNLLGEHVDYNDGLVLPAAIDREVHLVAAPRSDYLVSLAALDLEQRVEFRLADLDGRQDAYGEPLPGWAYYPAGVAWALRAAGLAVTGLDAAYTSDVPIGAGLSSSAAVEVGFGVLWQALGGWRLPPLRLAQHCQQAENGYVGLSCGLMDQFASACGQAGHALLFDTRSLEWSSVPLPEGLSIIIADSGVRRSLTHSGYNERRATCKQAVDSLQRFMPAIRSLRDVPPTEFAAYAPYIDEIPRKRAEHVIKEIARVESMVRAMQRRDLQAIGALMYAGHASLRNLYEVSTTELDTLVELSRGLPGIIGARLTGAGFGGCTVNLVETTQAEAFITGLRAGYCTATGREVQVYLCQASPGAGLLPL
jgi:galactokinase